MRRVGSVLTALILAQALVVAAARAAELEALKQTCSACHGERGMPISHDIPVIAGQPFTVIEDALILFADGKRPCTAMCAVAAMLSPLEKEALANHFEQQVFVRANQEFDPALATLGAELHTKRGCETCHASGGSMGNGMAPILAGQWTPYLRSALHQVKAGERSGPSVMNRAIRSLSDDEIEALLNFYARNGQQN